ncbi:MAG: UbiD [Deltaproteobacteria bacterium]|nr:UbiD [Deltaproteobacteria bacterium]
MIADLRDQIKELESRGELLRVRKEVNPRFELPALCKKMEAGKALLFEKVAGYSLPVAAGLDNRRSRIVRILNTNERRLAERYMMAIRHPLPPQEVEDGPIKEIKVARDIDLLRELPVVTHYEKDGGPFITAGVVIAEDPARRIRNLSYHRLQILDKDEIGIFLQPRHLWELFSEKEKRGEPLEVAIAIGLDTALRLAAATSGVSIPLGFDEYALAGALRQMPVEIAKGETVEVRVPARAEIVIEGVILPRVRKKEGPLVNFSGTYGEAAFSPVIKVQALTLRKDAVYQDLLPFSPEHHLLLALGYEPAVLQIAQARVPGASAVHITAAGCGRFHAVISVKKEAEEDGKEILRAVLNQTRDLKLVVAVDEDINPYDLDEVEWAVATRFQADRDLVVFPRSSGSDLDPSGRGGVTAKLGIDATLPLGQKEGYERARIPGIETINIEDYLRESPSSEKT